MEEDILDEREKKALESFLDNKVLKEAVKKIILTGVYYEGTLKAGLAANPKKNFILGFTSQPFNLSAPDAQIGAMTRACIEAIGMVERGFDNLEKFKKVEVSKDNKVNKAR